jgi:hypothetical protein
LVIAIPDLDEKNTFIPDGRQNPLATNLTPSFRQMSAQIAARVFAIGTPAVVGGLLGGFGMYYGVDAVCQSFNKHPWISGLVGALTGVGAGFLLSFYIFG